jgi:hypothetical protein
MVKRTHRNFLQTMEILQNQCYMSAGEAERKARQIFDNVEYDRKNGKVKNTVDDYLVHEINMAVNIWSGNSII